MRIGYAIAGGNRDMLPEAQSSQFFTPGRHGLEVLLEIPSSRGAQSRSGAMFKTEAALDDEVKWKGCRKPNF